MNARIPRYLIENEGADSAIIKQCFEFLVPLCRQQNLRSITLINPKKGDFPNGVVSSYLGTAATKQLCKGQTVAQWPNVSLSLESATTISSANSYEMVVGIYLSARQQVVLDSLSAKAITLIPWNKNEGEEWLSTWNVNVLGNDTWQVRPIALPFDVEERLLDLSKLINLSNTVFHSSDKSHAKDALVEIKKLGHTLRPGDIKKWAYRHNWHPDTAEELEKLASRIFD